jgi:hypothetical protein
MESSTLPMRQSTTGARSGAALGAGSTSASRRFPAATTSVGQARRFLIEQHAATEFEVSVHIAADASSVRVEVSDDARGYPTPQDPVGDAPHGRGLHIVRTVADAWGLEMHRGREGKTVWFSSALPASDRPVTEAVTEPPSGRAGPDGNGDAESPAPPVGTAAVEPTFPVKGVRAVLDGLAPGKALERLNRVSLSGVGPRLATALVGLLDTATGMISFASAGHPSPVRVESGQAHELPVPPGPPLGVQHCHYKDHELRMDRGCVMMFTDGLVERRGPPSTSGSRCSRRRCAPARTTSPARSPTSSSTP